MRAGGSTDIVSGLYHVSLATWNGDQKFAKYIHAFGRRLGTNERVQHVLTCPSPISALLFLATFFAFGLMVILFLLRSQCRM